MLLSHRYCVRLLPCGEHVSSIVQLIRVHTRETFSFRYACTSLAESCPACGWHLCFASSAFGFALDSSQTRAAATVNSLDDFDSSSTIICPCDRLTGKKIHKQTLHIHTRIQPSYVQFRESLYSLTQTSRHITHTVATKNVIARLWTGKENLHVTESVSCIFDGRYPWEWWTVRSDVRSWVQAQSGRWLHFTRLAVATTSMYMSYEEVGQ
jgi:hypothetical protein